MAARSSGPVGLLCCGALIFAIAPSFIKPVLFANRSESAPVGLYIAAFEDPAIGDYVLVRLEGEAARIAQERRYLGVYAPALKKLAAGSGDEVCRRGGDIFINKKFAAKALFADRRNRPMAFWSGCMRLSGDQVFLLNDHPESYDGRYFGAIGRERIIAIARPLFTMSSGDRE